MYVQAVIQNGLWLSDDRAFENRLLKFSTIEFQMLNLFRQASLWPKPIDDSFYFCLLNMILNFSICRLCRKT